MNIQLSIYLCCWKVYGKKRKGRSKMPSEQLQVKVVLLGKAYAGKTCLVARYIHDTFNEKYQNTIGAAFASKKLKVSGRNITLNIWDTAGGERYQSMTRMYYRGARAAILCYDLTDKSSFEKLRFWVGELQENETHCKLYLCGTKKDLVDVTPGDRAIDERNADALAQDLQSELFETSSLTGENINALFQKIAEEYVLNRKSYPENEPKGTEEDKEDSIQLDSAPPPQHGFLKSCVGCVKG